MKWKKVKLKDMAGINGVFKDGDWVESKDQDPNGDVRLIQMADIGERVYKDKSQRFMTSESFDKLNCTEIIKGDILISRMPDPIGRACIFEGDDKKCATVVDICIIRVDQEIVNSRWLMHRINFIDIRTQIEMKATGTTRKRIARSKLGELEIPLPPMDIQIKIAEALDKAQELIDNRKEQIAKYDELLQSVFLDMFGDPVTNPKGWEVKTIEEFTSKDKYSIKRGPFGGALKKEIFVDEGYLVYEQYHALNNDFSFERYYITEDKFEELKAFEVVEGDIIISCSGVYLGKLAVIPKNAKKGIINQALLKVKLDDSLMNNTIFKYIFTNKHFKSKYFPSDRGSGVPNFPSMNDFKKFRFILPPLTLQNQFSSVVEKVESEKNMLEESLNQLEDNFNSIMQRAFKGDLF